MSQSYTQADAGPMSGWSGFRFQFGDNPPAPKRFLKGELGLTGMEVSLNCMPVGAGMPFLHRHQKNEEVYLFLTGEGEFQAGDQVLPITPGACFRCSPELPRAWRNTGPTPMEFVVIQAEAGGYSGQGQIADGEVVAEPPAWKQAAATP